jgi:hypothetical protein
MLLARLKTLSGKRSGKIVKAVIIDNEMQFNIKPDIVADCFLNRFIGLKPEKIEIYACIKYCLILFVYIFVKY